MELYFIILLSILVIGFSGLFWFLIQNKGRTEGDQSLTLLQNQLTEVSRTLDNKLGEANREMREHVRNQFSESQKIIKEITSQISQVQESNKQVFSLAEQLQNLEKVLKNQKQRGNLGEAGLELILSNTLPPTAYKIQYEFKNGERVDAAIMTKEGVIPVDAKFSLEKYNLLVNEDDDDKRKQLEKEFRNDLKRRIDETAKYIRPQENTLPFAFMFIPAEGIYYDLLVNEIGSVKSNIRSLLDYAYGEKNVIVVSPTTFVAYLQVVLYGFRAFKIEQSAEEIRKYVDRLSKHLKSHDEYMRKLGNSLGTSVNAYNVAYKEFRKMDKDIYRINGESADIDPITLEKPQEE